MSSGPLQNIYYERVSLLSIGTEQGSMKGSADALTESCYTETLLHLP